jgi:hypothetical protein
MTPDHPGYAPGILGKRGFRYDWGFESRSFFLDTTGTFIAGYEPKPQVAMNFTLLAQDRY